MPNYRLAKPQILWGPAFANTLNIAYPLDNVASWSAKRDGSTDIQTPSGLEESWTVGTDYILRGDVRWIPISNTASPLATGWDGATGFRAFLEWARDKNLVRFIPDSTAPGTYTDSYLVDPRMTRTAITLEPPAQAETDGSRNFTLILRNSVSSYDGY